MSGIDPRKLELYRELTKRKAQLPPHKQLLVDELGKRLALDAGGDPSGKAVDREPGMLERGGRAVRDFVSEEGPAMAGAAIGGTMGAMAGPPGIVAGGAMGGAAGEAVKQGIRKVIGGGPSAQSAGEFAGDLNRAMLTGATQEAGAAVAAAMPGAAAHALVKSPAGAERQMQRVLSPTTKENKFLTAKVAPGLVEKKFTAWTRGDFLFKAEKAKKAAATKLEQEWANIPRDSKLKTKAITDSIDRAKQEFIVDNVEVLPAATQKLDELKGIVEQFGPEVSPESLRRTRQVWDMIVDQAGGFGGKDLAAQSQVFAQKQAADAIRREIGSKFPNIQKLNAEFTFWSNVDDIMQATVQRDINKGVTMTDLISSSTGIGVAASGQLWGAAIPILVRTLQSTVWRTNSAALKKGLSDVAVQLSKGNGAEATKIIARLAAQAGISGGSADSPTTQAGQLP